MLITVIPDNRAPYAVRSAIDHSDSRASCSGVAAV